MAYTMKNQPIHQVFKMFCVWLFHVSFYFWCCQQLFYSLLYIKVPYASIILRIEFPITSSYSELGAYDEKVCPYSKNRISPIWQSLRGIGGIHFGYRYEISCYNCITELAYEQFNFIASNNEILCTFSPISRIYWMLNNLLIPFSWVFCIYQH